MNTDPSIFCNFETFKCVRFRCAHHYSSLFLITISVEIRLGTKVTMTMFYNKFFLQKCVLGMHFKTVSSDIIFYMTK